MFPKKPRAGLPEFPRTAVAGVAGGGENLRRGLSGIEVGLGVNRESCGGKRCSGDPRQNLTNPRHGYPSVTTGSRAGHHDVL
jgi:hypothetical protein